jgi:hypothetical protein
MLKFFWTNKKKLIDIFLLIILQGALLQKFMIDGICVGSMDGDTI